MLRKIFFHSVLISFGGFISVVNSQADEKNDIEKLTAILLRNGFADDEIGDALKVLRLATSAVSDNSNHRHKRQIGSLASASNELDESFGQADQDGALPHDPLAATPIAAPIRNRNQPLRPFEEFSTSSGDAYTKRAGYNVTSTARGRVGYPAVTPTSVSLPGLPIGLPGLPVIDEARQRKIVEFVGRIFGSIASLFS